MSRGEGTRWCRPGLSACLLLAAVTITTAVSVAVGDGAASSHTSRTPVAPSSFGAAPLPSGIHKIKHVIVIMQENRSFDSYFGTYRGADGFPARNGHFTVCVPDPARHSCSYPYYERRLVNFGARHTDLAATMDVDGGKMDGFVRVAEQPGNPSRVDVMGYHDARAIPNYWTYARDFVLQDHMFEPVSAWSLPAHLFTVSEWSATCSSNAPSSCVNDPQLAKIRRRVCFLCKGLLAHSVSKPWANTMTGNGPYCEAGLAPLVTEWPDAPRVG